MHWSAKPLVSILRLCKLAVSPLPVFSVTCRKVSAHYPHPSPGPFLVFHCSTLKNRGECEPVFPFQLCETVVKSLLIDNNGTSAHLSLCWFCVSRPSFHSIWCTIDGTMHDVHVHVYLPPHPCVIITLCHVHLSTLMSCTWHQYQTLLLFNV